MGGKSRSWTDVQLIRAAAENLSIAGVLRAIRLHPCGGSYVSIHQAVQRLGIDTSHWTGQAHLRGGVCSWSRKRPLDEFLVEHCKGSRHNIKSRLIRDGRLKNQCAICGMKPKWMGKPISLVLDHENGVNDDYRIGNLRLLCPNCNSQTDTFTSRNKSKMPTISVLLETVKKVGVRNAAPVFGVAVRTIRWWIQIAHQARLRELKRGLRKTASGQ